MNPFLFSQMLLVNSLQSGKAWQACVQKREKSHDHKTLQFHLKLCTCPTSSASIQSVVGFKFFKRTGSLTPGLTNNRFSTTWEPLTQQPVLGIKEIPRTGSCEPVESHHCIKCVFSTIVIFQHRKQLGCRKGRKFDWNVPILQSWRR